MKIFLPFTIRGIGGTASFAKKFQTGMEALGHEVFFEYRPDYDVMFLIVQAPFKYLLEAKKKKKPIIQRLDGTYYWSVAGWKFPLYNLKAAIIRHLFADFTVYQSHYSKHCAEHFLGAKEEGNSTIIFNGVDTEQFSPLGESLNLRDYPDQKIFFTASAFRRTDQIFPILESLKAYEKHYGSNYKLVIAGTFTGEVSGIEKQLRGYKNLSILGKIENAELPKYERSADVFLFTHLNPPCPNNIIEALACGLPVCGVADGAMPELIQDGIEGVLVPTHGTAFWKRRHIDSSAFADGLHRVLENRDQMSLAARATAMKKFSINNMLSSYIETITHTSL
jgi:glycosyltransferase involved in cell wall biosynthesis